MTQDMEMKEQTTPSNFVISSSPSTLHYLNKFLWVYVRFEGNCISDRAGAYDHEARHILRAIRLTMALRRKLKPSVLSSFLTFTLSPGSEALTRLKLWLPPYSSVSHSRAFVLSFLPTLTFSRLEPGGKLIMCFRKASTASASDQFILRIQLHFSYGSRNFLSMNHAEMADPSLWSKIDKSGHIAKESLGAKVEVSRKRKNIMLGSKSKRLRIHNEDFIELKLTWEEAQGLLHPPPNHVTSVVIESFEFEEYESVKQGSQGKPEFKVESPVWRAGKLYRLEAVNDVHILELNWALPCLLQEYLKKLEDYLAHLLGHDSVFHLLQFPMLNPSSLFNMLNYY
ncbi:hypothetical protein F3Y22_tig00110984pilonHSYRG00161 [Hibiscus syriacus]|uniref:Uncharacterized protein n=1 Tax=Hibiscus syriacus TaxID=106335 RepID=A0A6A2ZA95_HIBSY|nr:hypothetical protein F3Y22_tig00110984pilonHSYRG00161 [Hibiscus syriacus]